MEKFRSVQADGDSGADVSELGFSFVDGGFYLVCAVVVEGEDGEEAGDAAADDGDAEVGVSVCRHNGAARLLVLFRGGRYIR